MKTRIAGGTIADGLGGRPFRADLLIDGERIAEISPRINAPDDGSVRTVDASGCLVTPGFIDIHRHADAAVSGRASAGSNSGRV